ncbi:MAG: hypothetical protein A2161_13725 [Candidatus Schekmanbacteria bacterium RBG_13_48_7]|uniref:Uncharacterized protein n=1 Tax=Candidatus Schekmanbacteria bacterium RBG_13_48_7 TaxID=1817878 RepID=A0A1F7RZX7_9BACT|nr:MAG: hypothetical protein A2161_13725 [Candidatus Schekmanbacteria bacterium RBG_13_48_7]
MTDKQKEEVSDRMQKLAEDKMFCLRCNSQMYKLQVFGARLGGIETPIEFYACPLCGKIELYTEVNSKQPPT